MILGRLFRRSGDSAIPAALYGAIVAQARQPALYRDLGIADTVDGRFEAVVLHTVLVLRRLGAGDEELKVTGQEVFDLFCTEMDRSLRELGVSDLRIPKRMRRIGEIYYGRSATYGPALDDPDGNTLAESLERNLPAAEGARVAAAGLAAYIKASDAALRQTAKADLLAGRLPFADASAFVGVETSDGKHATPHQDN